MNKNRIKIFSDFDGTATKFDVGHLIFKTFAGEGIRPIIQDWKNNLISSKELLTRECELINIDRIEDLYNLIDKQELDDFFVEFCSFTESNGIELFLVSDGLDVYIKRILAKYELNYISYYANHFEYKTSDEGRILFIPSFPYTDSECHKCGNCKRNHLLYNSEDEDFVIYIGDGYSDRCPVEFADLVFAKRELASYCNSKKIPFTEFTNFNDIKDKVALLLEKKRLKRRRQAELRRKEIFMQG